MNPKQILIENSQALQKDFDNEVNIHQILIKRSNLIDSLLVDLWVKNNLEGRDIASLIAVGGYGRQEMHPSSDIDLLLLLSREPDDEEQALLSDFITVLWDLGLEVGHSVRTLDECAEEAEKDLTVITNLMESRFLSGNVELFHQLQERVSPSLLWASSDFFTAKIEEQRKRYKHYGDSAYRVEPNLKEGPGGLRDIQMINWIIQREYGTNSLSILVKKDIISQDELNTLVEGLHFLWKVRFVLHQLAGRKEDRLLFNHQRPLAHQFGFINDENNHCIEEFMQQYYRTITSLERITEVTLGILRESICPSSSPSTRPINEHYLNHNGYLHLANKDLFQNYPHTLLEVFFMLQTIPKMKGMSPNTIRAIRDNLHLIDQDFRDNNHHKQLFMSIMSESQGITFVLRRMNRYGVLAAYIPAFAHIVGRMQYDLFHAYTVDEHTLKVIRNVRRLSTDKGIEELPFCSQIFASLPKPQILYLAALFHDIAKGRGGSHSEKGAVDALAFCRSHDMSTYAANTVSWLVKQHLEMSSVAQRKDISDPEVIQAFADKVSIPIRLDYLYLLTICDIRGTNPTLLNSWRHTLLKDLYTNTRRHLLSNGSLTTSTEEILKEKKESVLQQLSRLKITSDDCTALWDRFNDDYILQTPINMLLWHAKQITPNHHQTVIAVKQDSNNNSSTLLLIYAKNCDDFFVRISAAIEQLQLSIVAARIHSTNDDSYALDTLHLLSPEGKPIADADDIALLIKAVEKSLNDPNFSLNTKHYRTPRQLKYFNTITRISFTQNTKKQKTVITINTADSPGLLSRISQVFHEQGVHVHSARISTLGEQAEDIFHITLKNQTLLEDIQQQKQIEQALQEHLKGESE